ncbi:hypothetical protein MIN45_P2236 [Methylomarinovum tepidoasis]|uniref:AB hydrolase-1 domain-containing protein n=1 Tax=Methylomarinovum tepidoasis TaxID=2840183 RepID=A0AAU9C851_9GAMM|nr:alpha/beta fold hydrolase [Methylomarinovum sp. IN45]BCX89862.1 hypothetical protein MIN45_P2236 [Methylomarinovum sp. IN45]
MRLLLPILVILLVSSGCGLREIHHQAQTVAQASVIEGRVQPAPGSSGPLIVHLYRRQGMTFVSDTYTRADEQGRFRFHVRPGTYYIGAHIDTNGDQRYQEGEAANYYQRATGVPLPIRVAAGEYKHLPPLPVRGHPPALQGGYRGVQQNPKRWLTQIGKVTALDDPAFSRENAALGLWKPLSFLERVGAGLYFLQPYRDDRIPVLFIHGMGGTPLDWRTAIERLDRDRFQPWVLHYPSGLPLTMITDYAVQALTAVQNRYHPPRLILAAHSMGGLVAHGTLRKYRTRHPDAARRIGLLVTINSPLGGMPSAAQGVAHSPIVIPAWHDLAPNSDYLRWLQSADTPLPPYYLIFSYEDGDSSDGVVPLQSQIPLIWQHRATRIYGFQNSHTGTLKNEDFLALFFGLLDAQAR